MTDIQPFRGLRYDPTRVDADAVVAPPYDVVSQAQVQELMDRSPHNIAHIESCPGTEADRYDQAAALLQQWQADGVLQRDDEAAYYVYEQRSTVLGERVVRRQFFAQMRLYPTAAGTVRPHEATLEGPKAERLQLQRATKANVSPIFVMYPDPESTARDALATICETDAAFSATDLLGDEHLLWPVTDPAVCSALTGVVAANNVTIADGHHRYATALNYLEERGGDSLPQDAPERFVLVGLVAEEEPGLTVLPNHRLVRGAPDDLMEQIDAGYWITEWTPDPWDDDMVNQLWKRVKMGAFGPITYGVLGATGKSLHLLTKRDDEEGATFTKREEVLRKINAVDLTECILTPMFGLDTEAVAKGDRVSFTEDIGEAWAAVDRGDVDVAFMINPTTVAQITAVADAGEVLPQKATFFYPKLATGMVINPLD